SLLLSKRGLWDDRVLACALKVCLRSVWGYLVQKPDLRQRAQAHRIMNCASPSCYELLITRRGRRSPVMQTITPGQLTKLLSNVALTRPVFIWGPPGIGKSALVEQ